MNYIYFESVTNEIFSVIGDNRKWIKTGINKMMPIAIALGTGELIVYGKEIYIGDKVRCYIQFTKN